jgi:hypothetical protein
VTQNAEEGVHSDTRKLKRVRNTDNGEVASLTSGAYAQAQEGLHVQKTDYGPPQFRDGVGHER